MRLTLASSEEFYTLWECYWLEIPSVLAHRYANVDRENKIRL